METEVYLLCKTCNGVTDGIGSGDTEDLISCVCCGKKTIRAYCIGYLRPLDQKEKRLYVEKDKFEIVIKK